MKQITILTIISFFFISITFSKAQEYSPMAVEGATWILECNDGENNYTIIFRIEGETTIDSVVWKKVFFLDAGLNPTFPYTVIDKYWYSIIRDDIEERKVYIHIVNSNLPSYLYGVPCWKLTYCISDLHYNFNMEPGDLFENHCPFLGFHDASVYLSSITEEFRHGKMRKILKFSFNMELVEGVGFPYGPFLKYWPNIQNWAYGKSTYCVGDIETCILSASNKELIHSNILSVFPNPGDGRFTIGDNISVKQVSVFDTHGKLYHSGKSASIDLSDAPSQIYYVKVLDELGKVHVQRLMKQ